MMADLPRLSVADLVDGAVCRPFLDPAGGISEPFLVVDLDDIGDTPIEAALPYARSHDAVLVGVATGPLSPAAAKLAETLDVTVVPSGVPGLTEDDGTRYGAAG